jgi:hypothetical protein
VTNKIPARTELTVIPADDPKMRTIGWTVTERNGVTLFKFDAAGGIDIRPLLSLADLVEGDEIAVAALTGGYHKMTVKKDEEGKLMGCNDSLLAILRFAEDDRKCWTCVGLINTRGLAKLDVTR